MYRLMYPLVTSLLALSVCSLAHAQSALVCTASSTPATVRGEGITERVGDIVLNCAGGTAGATITGNLSVILNVNITNRLGLNSSTVTGVVFTIDSGSGPQTVTTPGTLTAPNTLTFNGLSFTLSPSGTAVLRIADIRGAATEVMLGSLSSIQAFLSINSLAVNNNQLTVGNVFRGLYSSLSSPLVCAQTGSPLPTNTASLVSFLASNAIFNTTRVTEGFAGAFSPLNSFQGLNADTGTRIMVQYSGFPQGAQLFVPNVVTGSDAVKPTAGGNFGFPASGGQYAPGNGGSLLLARVFGTDANGAGGSVAYSPGAPGSGTVTFDTMSAVTLTGGSGFVVYEVVDSNPSVIESAQFPTFLGLAPSGNGTSTTTSETVSFAPVSTVNTATATDPIPRFQQLTAPSDCSIIGDCGAAYFPVLNVPESSLQYTAQSGAGIQTQYVQVQNGGGGAMSWNASIQYTSGSNWLQISPASGTNDATIRVDANPAKLAAGTYTATLIIDAGPAAGAKSLPVTFSVTAAPPPPTPVPTPTVTAAVNAATFATGPLVPGSLATLSGTLLSGNNVSVTFNGMPAQVLYDGSTQVNLMVPTALGSATSAQLVVTVDGNASAPQTVNLVPFSPGIFANGILNQDNTVNGASHPAAPGSVIQIFATGLSGTGVITATIAGQTVTQPYYAGPAPELTGVQQVNLIVPTGVTGSTVPVSVCGGPSAAQVVCSPAVQLAVSQWR